MITTIFACGLVHLAHTVLHGMKWLPLFSDRLSLAVALYIVAYISSFLVATIYPAHTIFILMGIVIADLVANGFKSQIVKFINKLFTPSIYVENVNKKQQ